MKAAYLALVYASPLLVWLLPVDWFQSIWVPLYVPFAIAIGLVTYFRPRSEMFAWIFATPLLFWVLVNVIVTTYFTVSADGGVANFGSSMLVVLFMSTPIGLVIGAYCILFALGLFTLFRARQWLT